MLVTSAQRIRTTLESVPVRPQLRLLLNTSRPRARLLAETSAQASNKASKRSPTWSVRYTLSSTTRRSRPMCSAAGCTSRTQAYALLTTAWLARPKCSSSTTRTRFRWARASMLRRNSMIRQERSAASDKTLLCPRMRPSPGNEGEESEQLSSQIGDNNCSVDMHIAQKV